MRDAGRIAAAAEVLDTIATLRSGTRKAHRRAPENHHQDQIISTWIERRSSA